MRNPLLVPDLRELIQAGESAALREFFRDQHPARAAEMIEDLEPEEGDMILSWLEPRTRAEVMSYLPMDRQVQIVEKLPPADAAALLHHMSHDERADLVNHLDEERVEQILPRLAQAEREDIRRLASYEPGTAGAVMTTDYVALPPHLTVREALDRIRHEAPDRETIYYNYVIDPQRRLIGFVSLKSLILARPSATIESIMQKDVIYARVDENQETVARRIDQYDLLAIPVIDAADMLVGIVTHDDAADILRREQTEDLLAFGGVSATTQGEDPPYWQVRVGSAVRRRINWLLMLFVAENFTYPVLHYFNWVEKRYEALGWFVPLLIGTGGNAGSQSVGTIIRALALGEVTPRDAARVILREWLIGLLLGLALGAVGFVYARYWRVQPWNISAVIGLTILGICMWANFIGSLVPLLARRLGIDPAIVSAPLISTLVDATGLVMYFTIAILLLIRI
ncbi:MAG TPA: magnesium transporter [Isosphaeraceae bacterium]|jgi:magnesium transporter|nr:magnesium transporter [Isosphaeraceae bacterium]